MTTEEQIKLMQDTRKKIDEMEKKDEFKKEWVRLRELINKNLGEVRLQVEHIQNLMIQLNNIAKIL